MHPLLSWSILLTVILIGYIAIKGLPPALQRQVVTGESNLNSTTKTKKRKTRKDKSSTSENQTAESRKLVPAGGGAGKSRDTSVGDSPATVPIVSNGGQHAADSSFDAVEHVMSGRPRKTSTPIGYLQHKLSSSLKEAGNASTSEDESHDGSLTSANHSEDQWQHVSARSSDEFGSPRPRTLKIVSSNSSKDEGRVTKTKPKKVEEQLTKKQRQNAAKKAKQREEKAMADERQAAALRAHKKSIETQRIQALRLDPAPAKTTQPNSAWTENDWETVSKSKKVSNNAPQKANQGDDLIW